MNIQQLRHSLKIKWLLYYRQNRPWLVQLRIWGTYDGQRRPSSSFILAALSNLEPQLIQMFPLIVALNNDPDKIVAALGLNFNPDEELKSLKEPILASETNGSGNGVLQASPVVNTNGNGNGVLQASPVAETNTNENDAPQASSVVETSTNENGLTMQTLSGVADEDSLSPSTQASNLPSWVDESCHGKGSPNVSPKVRVVLSILAVIGSLAVVFASFTGVV